MIVVLAAAGLAGCGSAHRSAQHDSRPTAARSASATAAPASPTAAPSAPAAGSLLATQQVAANGDPEVVTDGAGFAIVDGSASPSQSTITTYDVAGQELTVITGGFTADCGAADVLVPGTGRLIITELITGQAAQGVQAATTSVQLTARNAVTGATVWTATVVRSTTEALNCVTGTGLGYANSSPDLLNFGVTNDGKWGLYANGSQRPEIVNLGTGTTRADLDAQGTLGGYIVDACAPNNVAGSALVNTITNADTGAMYGQFLTESDAYHVRSFCSVRSNPNGDQSLSFDSPDDLEFVPAGLFFSDSAASAPGSGLTSEGDDLLVDNVPSINSNTADIVRYALPAMQQVWRKKGQFSMWGDGGGIVVVSPSGNQNSKVSLVGLDDETGARIWQLSSASGGVCAVTSTQILYAVNSQLAVLSVKTGKQLSYTSNPAAGNQCPSVLPGGISWNLNGTSLTVTQALAP